VHVLVIILPKGIPGKSLLEFAGKLSESESDELMHIIEEGCEKVDSNEW